MGDTWDYCYDPTCTCNVPLSGDNDNTATDLQACIGECDADDQCGDGLICYQRENGEDIPGCTGSGEGDTWDYCYNPDCDEGASSSSSSDDFSTSSDDLISADDGTSSGSCALLGDLNNDGSINVLDVVSMVSMILGAEYDICADVTGDGTLDVLDAVSLLQIILY